MEGKKNCGGCYFKGDTVDIAKKLIYCFLWQKAVNNNEVCDYWKKFTNGNRDIVQKEAERLRGQIEREKKEKTDDRRHEEQMALTERIHKKEIKVNVLLFIGSLIGSLIVGFILGKYFA